MKKGWIIEISEDGSSVTVKAHGFKGKGCAKMAEILKELGPTIEETKLPEYYQSESVCQKVTGK